VLGSASLPTPSLGWTTVDSQSLTVGQNTIALAKGDFNGDGLPDIAVANQNNSVSILLGGINGIFAVSTVQLSFSPYSIAVADFNGDGFEDIAVGNFAGSLTVLLGNGDGTFPRSVTSNAPGDLNWMTPGDFNGDGIPDFAMPSVSGITVLLGNGDGSFTAVPFSVPLFNTRRLIGADFNGDGVTDLLINLPTGLTTYLSNGDGTFTATSSNIPSGSNGVEELATADFNGDGKLDLLVWDGSTNALGVYLGNGNGTFSVLSGAIPITVSFIGTMIGDFNGDGIADVATGPNIFLFGKGDGTFSVATSAGPIQTNTPFTQLAVAGDFNRDGRTDLAWPANVGPGPADFAVQVYWTQPTQTTTTAPTLISPGTPGDHMTEASYGAVTGYAASVSGPTLLWGQPPATTTTLALTAGGSPATAVASGTVVTLTAAVSVGATPLTVGQVRFCDATAAACQDEHLVGSASLTPAGTATFKFVPGSGAHSYRAVLVENASGLSSSSAAQPLSVGAPPHVLAPTTATIAESGTIGAYSLTSTVVGVGSTSPLTGSVSFLDTSYANKSLATGALGTSTASYALPVAYSTAFTNPGSIALATGDFNGDGFLDIASMNTNSATVSILLGHGNGTFTAAASPTLSANATGIVAADFNNDGKLDLAVSLIGVNSNAAGSMVILLGNGDGTFTPTPGTLTLGGSPNVFAAADFDGDGRMDLLENDEMGTQILLGNGNGTLSQLPYTGMSGAYVVADLNGDGFPDVMANGGYYIGNEVLLGNGDGTFRAVGPAPSSPTFTLSSFAVGDFNGDGIPDLAGVGQYTAITIFLGKGDGTFTLLTPPASPTFTGPGGLVAGDFNHDGKLDLAVTAGVDYSIFTDANVTLLLGNGDGTFTAVPESVPIVTNYALSAGDFNGDGVPDMAAGSGTGVSVLLTEPSETATANGISPAGPSPHVIDASYPGDSNFLPSTSGSTSLNVQVATPVFAPAAGAFTTYQSVTLTDATPGATIYWENVASYPFVWNVYNGPIPMKNQGALMLEAYATEAGYFQSAMTTATYTLTLPPPPSFSLAGGTYNSPQSLVLTDSLPGASIYDTYTPSGTVPTTASTLYTGPITINATGIVEAIASAPGYSPSVIASKAYTYVPLPPAAAPYFNLAGGTYHSPQLLTLTDATPGAGIHHTTNGTTPTAVSTLYTGPITVASTETVEAVAIAAGYSLSPPAAKSYTYLPYPPAAAPAFSLAGGTYNTPQKLTITDATAGATIYYTTNGTSPTTSSAVYSGPITIASTETVEAAAIATGYSLSPISSKAYTYSPLPLAATPYFSLAGGHYTTPQTLTLTDSTPGAAIYYTTDGTMPTTASTHYTGPTIISTSETVIAITAASGYSNSNPASKTYTIP
jgi:Chitobiase/beta-hexosaminidase C-terminal domain/FG-GAP-like repeat/FG-GAP repeat